MSRIGNLRCGRSCDLCAISTSLSARTTAGVSLMRCSPFSSRHGERTDKTGRQILQRRAVRRRTGAQTAGKQSIDILHAHQAACRLDIRNYYHIIDIATAVVFNGELEHRGDRVMCLTCSFSGSPLRGAQLRSPLLRRGRRRSLCRRLTLCRSPIGCGRERRRCDE